MSSLKRRYCDFSSLTLKHTKNPIEIERNIECEQFFVKLSHYLDVIELELVKHVSKKTHSFFKALKNVRELHQEVQHACQHIETLRYVYFSR
jgi:hypothetical protein